MRQELVRAPPCDRGGGAARAWMRAERTGSSESGAWGRVWGSPPVRASAGRSVVQVSGPCGLPRRVVGFAAGGLGWRHRVGRDRRGRFGGRGRFWRRLVLGMLGLGDDCFEALGDPAELVEQRAPLVRHGGDVGLQRANPRLGVLVERGDLVLGLLGPRLRLDARPGERVLGLVVRVCEDLVGLGSGAGHKLVGLGRGTGDRVTGLMLRAGRDVLRLRLGARGRVLGLLARACRDLLGSLPRVLQDAARLLADAVEGVADRCPRRTADLQLGDQGVDSFDVGVDCAAIIAPYRCREGRVADVVRQRVADVYLAAAWRRDAGRRLPLLMGSVPGFVPSHKSSMTNSPVHRSVPEICRAASVPELPRRPVGGGGGRRRREGDRTQLGQDHRAFHLLPSSLGGHALRVDPLQLRERVEGDVSPPRRPGLRDVGHAVLPAAAESPVKSRLLGQVLTRVWPLPRSERSRDTRPSSGAGRRQSSAARQGRAQRAAERCA
jgi:hypothetical protein